MRYLKTTKQSRTVRLAGYLVLATAMLLMLFFLPLKNEFKTVVNSSVHYEGAVVTAVLAEELSESPLEKSKKLGFQRLEVRLDSGETVLLDNYLTETHNIRARPGLRVIVCVDAPEGVEPYYTIFNYDRRAAIAGIVLLFAVLMIIVGGRKGLDAFLSVFFSLLFFLRVTIPAIYAGADPFAIGLLTVLVSSCVTIFLLHGLTARGLLAVSSTLAGTSAACLFFAIFSWALHVSGFQSEEAEGLIVVAQNTGLNLKNVFHPATMIASLGAAMDVTVSLLSALWELRLARPDSSTAALLRSGMNIGRDMIGTMSNTLIFAFMGGSLTTMLVLYSYGVQTLQLLNSDYVTVELASGLCATTAVILTVPLASCLAALVFPRLKIPGGVSGCRIAEIKQEE